MMAYYHSSIPSRKDLVLREESSDSFRRITSIFWLRNIRDITNISYTMRMPAH